MIHAQALRPRLAHCLAGLMLGAAALLAAAAPLGFWLAGGALAVCAAGLLAFDFPVAATVSWLVLTGCTPEYWLADGGITASALVAAEKLVALGLALICIGRYGFAFDLFNPGFAFLAIWLLGLQHGLHPQLEPIASLRSLAGSVAPFVFSFVRTPVRWSSAVIRCVRWLPCILVAAGAALAVAGVHPAFVDQSGFRLQATGIPAFLGGFAEIAIFACLLEAMRNGRASDLWLLGVNIGVLVLAGARMPMAVTSAVALAMLLFLPSPAVRVGHRLPIILGAAIVVPIAIAAAGELSDIRLFHVLSDVGSMSGRDLLWPLFLQAWEEQPLLGHGLGAAKVIVSPDSAVAHLTGTTAPHNEYLRIGVEGGVVGLALLVACLVAWTVAHTSRMPALDRRALRLVMIGLAVHAATDNLLISTTASVLFAWVSAAFARGEAEAVRGSAPEIAVARHGRFSP
ncbi:MAG: O-antigen ligase family protein [Acetobacteraceae bacterium]|nr:O-antigen ligase family protein [Acetobacteraceae bacterium]